MINIYKGTIHAKIIHELRICLTKLHQRENKCKRGTGKGNVWGKASMNETHPQKSLNEGKES